MGEENKDKSDGTDIINSGVSLVNNQVIKPTPEARTAILEKIKNKLFSDMIKISVTLTDQAEAKIFWAVDVPLYEGFLNLTLTFCGLTVFKGSIDL